MRHLDRFLDTAEVVVLAFDNYEYVPVAKCMTQQVTLVATLCCSSLSQPDSPRLQARRKKVPVEAFGETSPLPCMVPVCQFSSCFVGLANKLTSSLAASWV